MATLIEPCPFCNSGNLHISHRLMSHTVICQTCKSSGPHRRDLESSLLEWNHTAKLLRQARCHGEPQVHGHLHELEDAVRNLASLLRHDQQPQAEYESL